MAVTQTKQETDVSMQVDHAEIKTGQLLTMLIAVVAFVTKEPAWLMALVLFFLVTAFYRPASPFVLVYRFFIKPFGLMQSDYRLDNIQPHAFGQLVGALTVAVCLTLLYLDYLTAGWIILWILIGLTLVSWLGWCIGCFLYFQLNRLGLKGFFRHAPTDKSVVAGQRPRRQ